MIFRFQFKSVIKYFHFLAHFDSKEIWKRSRGPEGPKEHVVRGEGVKTRPETSPEALFLRSWSCLPLAGQGQMSDVYVEGYMVILLMFWTGLLKMRNYLFF